jgi:hypothetical protein
MVTERALVFRLLVRWHKVDNVHFIIVFFFRWPSHYLQPWQVKQAWGAYVTGFFVECPLLLGHTEAVRTWVYHAIVSFSLQGKYRQDAVGSRIATTTATGRVPACRENARQGCSNASADRSGSCGGREKAERLRIIHNFPRDDGERDHASHD